LEELRIKPLNSIFNGWRLAINRSYASIETN
jgi:hypothetical protein